METIINTPGKISGKTMAGIIIVIIGGLLLIDQLDLFFVPNWLLSWPMAIIAYGLYMGAKYNFKKPVYIWLLVIGTAFLLTDNIDNADRMVWPIAIIGTGAWMVMKHTKHDEAHAQDASYKEI
ncbi:LiaF transmembrane domain-containing protein [Mucilaginibacter xinganensis]|uniref:LiaF transmembrane domain-containing protein n=1 Tax=Mucilaginibacter xinganensis TaxID=1234841 RepID=A0A223NU91_9SPHI|nr:DUF5668 domain-containing protein [Mucilaginibacter xinganensis]ASU33208.1 hypothetical protein MuYL_1310 [Mucilaginibacter xinganensis]